MNNDKMIETNTTNPVITQEALAHLGDGRLAYVKAIRSEDVAHDVPAGAEDRARHASCSPCTAPTARRSC